MSELGTCPVCNDTKRVPAGDAQHKTIFAGYDKATDTLPCQNCGGQQMWGVPTGLVKKRPDGTPCTHEYTERVVGNCLREYSCVFCDHQYQIDSGD